ncbi:MAG: DNA translocase FtsK, partial [Rikenellaceae bacterium]
QADDENIDSEISLVEPIYQDENEPKQYVPQQTVQSREATILTNDYSQSIDKDNLVIFNPSGFDDITISSNNDKNMHATAVDKFVVGEDFPIEIDMPYTTHVETAVKQPISDDNFEISGGFTPADQISKDSFEVSVTSNASLDIDKIPQNENIKITTNETSELDNIDVSVYDPTLELSSYKLPSVELLDNHTCKVVVTEQELYENKNKILETLANFNIAIDKIKATIGPTVTLYEIKPAAGVRISKIKNLEDDIALSLSALGIRIIAPIPGKGTIGIEVPNKNKEIVSMYSVIKSTKFQESTYDLPIVLGRTIQNDDFVIDLAKMPHLLVAGATGQGKSVGLNAIITSLLYKKHPSELKFVLVDPKKVELTLYANIEKHFLAKMESEDEAIITDTQKVVYTLNSLCMEMDARYKLLKAAKVRNIKEYNEKFTNRRLNPNNGHRFLPYFVVIIDEFADLIMTAGREIEMPIARIAQLARAVGIHLVIATQRPTTNIITGVIKANFPARIAFRVSSMIDSRTILDHPGANQLIGRGDMLVSTGNEIVRVQCAFIDTPEVERITDYIGSQKGYPTAYLLPEYVPESDNKNPDGGSMTGKLDEKFTDVARYVVQNQQGSASTIQRNFEVGFNRAGRIMDQLERAGIVGKQEGSKPRQVLISDMSTLELRLYDLENNK